MVLVGRARAHARARQVVLSLLLHAVSLVTIRGGVDDGGDAFALSIELGWLREPVATGTVDTLKR